MKVLKLGINYIPKGENLLSNGLEFILDNKLWSYSCLESFENCRYYWYLNYIVLKRSEESGCFAEFGSLGHSLLEAYLKGKLFSFELADKFTEEYKEQVSDTFPPVRGERLYDKYYDQGLEYFANTDRVEKLTDTYEILGVEDDNKFQIGNYKFTGKLDAECKNIKTGELELLDHKSKSAQHKKRLMKKTDHSEWLQLEDGRYVPRKLFHQQYLYCIPFKNKFGEYPKYLNLNMFRINDWYKLKFNEKDFEIAKQWAIDIIKEIYNECEWKPTKDGTDFFCQYLCSGSPFCKYSPNYVGER